MEKIIEISWTCGSIDEARIVSRRLVESRLVACAQIIPWIESVYMWDHDLQIDQETRVLLKAKEENFSAIRDVILEEAKYELPEIVYREIAGGSEEYLEWVRTQTTVERV